eukprot:m.136837 g.136837  ORF g.136837 m.136837 type:complete len:1075 (+) comp38192_c0_seq3:1337-4561(+)
MQMLSLLTLLLTFRFAQSFIPTNWHKAGAIVFGSGIDLGNFQWNSAVGSFTHKDITRQAVLGIAKKLLRDLNLLSDTVPAKPTADQLVAAAYGANTATTRFVSAIKRIEDANADVDSELADLTAAHFDGENFIGGNNRLLELRKDIIDAILKESYGTARELAGGFLHTLQDFYSHSNWVELGNLNYYDRLGVPGKQPNNVASPALPTCLNCARVSLVSLVGRCPSTTHNILLGRQLSAFLTSGYYSNQDKPKPDSKKLLAVPGYTVNDVGKCSHGGFLDGTNKVTATGGINKDSTSAFFSPHYDLHLQAADIAIKASRAFFDDLRTQVGDVFFLRFLGLDNGASLSFCIDTTGSMSDDIAQAKQQAIRIIEGSLAGVSPPIDFVFVPFNDPGFGPAFVSRNPDDFKNKISTISVGGGGDHAELAISGLILSLRASRPGSAIFLFTDASAKDYNRFPEASALISEKKIRIFVISTGSTLFGRRRRQTVTEYTALDMLADQSGGQVLSGSKSDVGSLLSLTSIFIETSAITLYSQAADFATNSSSGFHLKLPVDRLITELDITISGSNINPRVNVFGPDGNLVTLNSSNFVFLSSSAVLRLPNPSVGFHTIQIFSSGAHTVKVKGQSTFDFTHYLVKGNTAGHAGVYNIKGRPRIGETLFLRVTTSGLESSYAVKTALILNQKSTEILRLNLTTITDEEFLSTTSFVVPSESFLVAIQGNINGGNGTSFLRLDPNLETPVQFGVIVTRESTLSLVQGHVSNVTFRIVNGESYERLEFKLSDERNFTGASGAFTDYFSLQANEIKLVVVPFNVPSCITTGGTNEVTVVVKSLLTSEFNSFFINLQVVSESIDFMPPVCFVDHRVSCPDDVPCSSSAWSVTFSTVDTNTGLQAITNITNTLLFNASFSPGLRNIYVPFTANISCCVKEFKAQITDRAGNTGECSIGRDNVDSLENEACLCLNGGRCTVESTCFCLAGFYGDHCEFYGGCPPPSVPENGLLVSIASNSTFGSITTFECKKGFALIGEPQRTCCSFGWTGTTPECISNEVTLTQPSSGQTQRGSFVFILSLIGLCCMLLV